MIPSGSGKNIRPAFRSYRPWLAVVILLLCVSVSSIAMVAMQNYSLGLLQFSVILIVVFSSLGISGLILAEWIQGKK